MPLKDEELARFTITFVILSDDGHSVQHKYTGLNDLELAQQIRSINDVVIDLLRQGCEDTITIRTWKEDK